MDFWNEFEGIQVFREATDEFAGVAERQGFYGAGDTEVLFIDCICNELFGVLDGEERWLDVLGLNGAAPGEMKRVLRVLGLG